MVAAKVCNTSALVSPLYRARMALVDLVLELTVEVLMGVGVTHWQFKAFSYRAWMLHWFVLCH